MTRPLPENWEEQLADYALGSLGSEEIEAVKQLLETHPELLQEVDGFQEILALLPYTLPEVAPPANLRRQLLKAATVHPPRVSRWRSLPLWVGSAAAAVLIAVLGVDNYQLRQRLQDVEANVPPSSQATFVRRPLQATNQTTAGGDVLFNPNYPELVVAVRHLPAPPPGQVYRLWAIAQSGKVLYCGQFSTDAEGLALQQIPIPKDSSPLAEFRITLESSTAPLTPQGSLVLRSSI